MLVKDELIGVLSIAAGDPYRFERADEHLVGIIAGQIAVAVLNARLHDVLRRGKQEWEDTFDAISDPIAVFDGQRAPAARQCRARAGRRPSGIGAGRHHLP